MKQEIIKSELEVNDNKIKIITIDSKEFISLTDLARYANPEEPKIPIIKTVIKLKNIFPNFVNLLLRIFLYFIQQHLFKLLFICQLHYIISFLLFSVLLPNNFRFIYD